MNVPTPLACLALTVGAAAAQVSGIPPFVGGHFEGFEPPIAGNNVQCTSVPGFQTTATICTPYSLGIDLVASHALAATQLLPRTGTRFLRSLEGFASGAVEIDFETPVRRFGGWFAVGDPVQQVLWIAFYDAGGTLLGLESLDAVATGEWRWNGWEFPGRAVDRLLVSSNIEGWILMEDLEADADGAPGSVYCVAEVNSTGSPARIFTTGSASVAANDLVLHAAFVPEGQPGIFIYGPTAVQVPVAMGFLCVGSPARLPIGFAQGMRVSHALDVTAPPGGGGVITAGSTWYFQGWFRDPPGGGAGFNWSDGLEVAFVP